MKNATWYWEWTTDTTEDAVEIVYNYDAGDAGGEKGGCKFVRETSSRPSHASPFLLPSTSPN